MSEYVSWGWEGDPEDIPTHVFSDVPQVVSGDGSLDGEVETVFDAGIIPDYGGGNYHSECYVRQTPSNIVKGDQ